MIAHFGVDGVGEVDRRGACPQALRVAVAGEHEHLGLVEIDLQVFQELLRVGSLVRPVDHLAQPCELLLKVAALLALLAAFLVQPMRRNAELALLVHLLSTDLHLEGTTRRADDRRMQRLVHVVLRHRYVVFETAGHRVPDRVHSAKR